MVRYHIPDYFFEKFCESETYDIRQYITNKQVKFDLSKINPQHFPNWFMNFKYLRGYQIMGWAFFGASLLFLIYLFFCLGMSFNPHSCFYHSFWKSGGFFLGLIIILGVIAFPSLYLHSFFQYRLFNKMYLKKFIAIFKQMQTEGYIEQDLSIYPDSLQMAFYSKKEWKQKSNKKLKHYCSWFGILSLAKFFYDYDKQSFPININLPFDNWFADFCIQRNIVLH